MRGDQRLGQPWSRTQRIKNDLVYTLLRSVDTVAKRLPARWTLRLLTAVAKRVVARSVVARDNVDAVFPDRSPAERRALLETHAARLAQHAAAALAVAWGHAGSMPLPLLGTSAEVLRSAVGEGRGVILATAHLGSWERVAQTLLGAGLPLTAVSREPYDRRLGTWLTALRGNLPTIPRSAPGAARAMVRCLRAGGILLVPMDLATRGVETHTSAFLGRPTAIVTGPARLALHTGAAVVVATYTRTHDHEGLQAERLENLPAGPDAVRALTERLARSLTEAIFRCPAEWLWLHPRWTARISDPLYSPHDDGWEAPRS